MTQSLTPFESALMADSPGYLLRCTDDSFRLITFLSESPIEWRGLNPGIGPSLVPSDGVFGSPSLRYFGNSSPGYLRQVLPPALNYPQMTLVAVISKIRNPPGSAGASKAITAVISRIEVGGWGLDIRSYGLGFILNNGTGYFNAAFDPNLLGDSNLIHATYDGRYIKIYLNGDLKSTYDCGVTIRSINYGNAASLPMIVGSELKSNGLGDSSENFGDFDLSYIGLYGAAVSQAQIDVHVTAWSSNKLLAGTALLDDGSAAAAVELFDWQGHKRARVVPAYDGGWQACVPPGSYLVTASGGAGYRPVSHGPVVAVDP